MSKLVWVNYKISDAEERETRRKIALIRSMLERCARLQQELAKLEPVAGENWSEMLNRYRKLVDANKWNDFVDDYNRLYDELPEVERRLEKELTEAKSKRLRLELTAATLLASAATTSERMELEAISKRADGLYAGKFQEAQAKIEQIIRQRIKTPLDVADPALTNDQIALARDLLAASPTGSSTVLTKGGLGEPGQAPYGADAMDAATPPGRIIQLSEKLSRLDSDLVSVSDLVARLQELPAKSLTERDLLIDSIELEAQDRLNMAKRKREIDAVIDNGLAWLTPFQSLSAETLRERLTVAASGGDLAAARSASDDARAWAEAEGKRRDGERIRSVLLSELQELGYEVNLQGSAWDEGSRITIQKPSEPNYDVQLSAAPGGAIQSKVRAYDHLGRSSGVNRRDVEVEQGWCDELARVNKLLAQRGLIAEIVHQEGPGSSEQKPLPARTERDVHSTTARPIERKA
ncbi:hypothetical protein HYPDE_35063 [Hyphomicrobium denitrificans 1NES1]|uniref:Uncharacterized protein n=1 Tax=Hyphomicrobium denitrificans 1NES1 TaxID=670307 RepID=N0B581_9HYPH|nr:hypothetical protein [Hyphomicrobium denitrificans]AGK58684.1 hypothetical protein HYPDE_35063 [Hyphomicrobium denitrificans 1NES1]